MGHQKERSAGLQPGFSKLLNGGTTPEHVGPQNGTQRLSVTEQLPVPGERELLRHGPVWSTKIGQQRP